MEELSNASKNGRLQESLLTYTRPHILVIDGVGYLTMLPDAANVLFHVVNDRHLRKRVMIFTTNKPLSEWGKGISGTRTNATRESASLFRTDGYQNASKVAPLRPQAWLIFII